jgi:hypothetical protein
VKPKHNRYRPAKAEYTIWDYKMYAKHLDSDDGKGPTALTLTTN